MTRIKNGNVSNIVYLVWFVLGGLISALSYYDFNGVFSNIIPYFMISSLELFYGYSTDNKAIVFLFWFYLLTSPLALFVHCKEAIKSKKIELPTLYISLFGIFFMLMFMIYIFMMHDYSVNINTSGKMMGLLYWMITMSWWSTFAIYSLMYFVLFNSISSSINHYLNRKGI